MPKVPQNLKILKKKYFLRVQLKKNYGCRQWSMMQEARRRSLVLIDIHFTAFFITP